MATDIVKGSEIKDVEEEIANEEEEEGPGEFVEGWVLRRPKTPKDWVRRWAINSSCNGIPNIQRSRHPFRIVFWTLIVLAGTAMTGRDVVQTFQQYFSFPINVVLRVELQHVIEFPAVTVCNLNPVRKSKLYLAGADLESNLLQEPDIDDIGVASEQKYLVQEYYHTTFSALNESTKREMGHQIKDMLLGCSFGGKPCFAEEFRQFTDASYGNCYTFNSERDHNVRRVFKAGPKHGLTLELYIELQEYVPLLTGSMGMRIAVHNPEAMPFPEDTGVFISTGQSTGIAVRKVNITRLPHPFPSDCWNVEEDLAVNLSVYSQIYGFDYSEQACYKTCYQKRVIQNCSCGDPTLPLRGIAFGNDYNGSETTYACLTKKEEECETRWKEMANMGKLNCNCSVTCTALDFRPTVSSAVWPNKNMSRVYEAKLKRMYPKDTTGYTDPSENIARVHIFYPEMNTEFIEEQEAYSAVNLYSDLGGNVGFYLGLSIVSLFEFLELIPDVIRSWYRSVRHNKKAKRQRAMQLEKNGGSKKSEQSNDLKSKYETKYSNAL